jgi:tripartite-type tricarboxylate transporter receptor subunit TctC
MTTFLSSRRGFALGIAGALALLALVPAGRAQAQERPLQFIVGYPAGGGSDTLARILADAIKRTTGRAAIVRNVPGAGGQIAAVTALREGGDGSAILAINQPDLQLAVMRDSAALKASDFQTIMVDVRDPRVILVKRGSELSSFSALVERARARPGTVAVSVTAGSGQELFAKWLFQRLGLDVTVAGYRGGAEASNALLTGDVQASVGDDFARLNMRDTTQALVVGSKTASPRWPEAPTLSEALKPFGVVPPSPDFLSRYGIYAVPAAFKASQPAAYAELQSMLLKARGAPEVLDYIARNKLEDLSIARPGEAMGSTIDADLTEIVRIR